MLDEALVVWLASTLGVEDRGVKNHYEAIRCWFWGSKHIEHLRGMFETVAVVEIRFCCFRIGSYFDH